MVTFIEKKIGYLKEIRICFDYLFGLIIRLSLTVLRISSVFYKYTRVFSRENGVACVLTSSVYHRGSFDNYNEPFRRRN